MPDGDKIAFVSSRDRNREIYVMDRRRRQPDGGGLVKGKFAQLVA